MPRILPSFLLANYQARLQLLRPVAYWPLDEASGATAYDRSGNGYNGTHNNVTLGVAGIGDGRTAARYGGVNSLTDLYSAGLVGAFDGNLGSAAMWMRLDAPTWLDGQTRMGLRVYVSSTNRIQIYRLSSHYSLSCTHVGSGIQKSRSIVTASTQWIHVGMTWNTTSGEMQAYLNGLAYGASITELGTWVGAPATKYTILGSAATDTLVYLWLGNLAHVALWNRPLSAAEMLLIGRR